MIRLTSSGNYFLLDPENVAMVRENGEGSLIFLRSPIQGLDSALVYLFCDQSVQQFEQVLLGTHRVHVTRTGNVRVLRD